ncbi:hypothetical protein [Streptacidiphilus cavernicola]|uniref:Uncharacterized protein n=1 Tax=Streptacidiphilus cavernicola TaxID=3342716 RepID=A0ABV6VXN6_9ACTN
MPDDAESQAVARLITTRMVREAAAAPASWWDADEPRLPDEWRRVAAVLNTGLWLTPDELQALSDADGRPTRHELIRISDTPEP